MPFTKTKDGTKLFYNDWRTTEPQGNHPGDSSAGGRTIVLIHGWPVTSDMWEHQATALVLAGYRVIAYDRRGFGRSDQPWTGYDYDTLSDDLAAVLEGRDVQDAALVGFSMGGGEVARYMARHAGRRVARAVFVSAVTPFLRKTDDNPEGVDGEVFEQMQAGLESDRPAFLTKFGKRFYGAGLVSSPVSSEALQWTSALALQGSARATRACARSFAETDFRSDLAACRVPTLFIHGDADETVPIDASARRAVKLVPGAQLKEYAGAPHGLFMTERAKLTADLREFCR